MSRRGENIEMLYYGWPALGATAGGIYGFREGRREYRIRHRPPVFAEEIIGGIVKGILLFAIPPVPFAIVFGMWLERDANKKD